MSKLGVLVLHGMGNQSADYADPMIEELQTRLRHEGANPDHVAFQPVFWGHVLDGRENKLYRRMTVDHDLDYEALRKNIVIGGLGDALAYVGPATAMSDGNAIYKRVHAEIAAGLRSLREDLSDGDDAPLVIMAHSLGCAIACNYVWDHQNGKANTPGTDPFSRAETLSGMITFGCNLPLFTLAYPPENVSPIAFPGSNARACFGGLPDAEVNPLLRWDNYFDSDDVLGFPLRPLNDRYAAAVTEDIQIQTGTIIGAHTDYWTDNNFTRPVARHLARLVQALV